MAYEAKPNTSTIFIAQGLFSKKGVEAIQATKKPILKAYINVDGKDLEIAFRFRNTWDDVTKQYTDELYVTSTGNKMLTGKVELPFVANAVESAVNEPFMGDKGRDFPDDDDF